MDKRLENKYVAAALDYLRSPQFEGRFSVRTETGKVDGDEYNCVLALTTGEQYLFLLTENEDDDSNQFAVVVYPSWFDESGAVRLEQSFMHAFLNALRNQLDEEDSDVIALLAGFWSQKSNREQVQLKWPPIVQGKFSFSLN